MNTISLLNDKFEPARLPDICAPRRKLLEVYSQAAGRRRVYVCAPAGYGKTVTTLSVSYTHLDVYKRQFLYFSGICPNIILATITIATTITVIPTL